MVIDKLPFAVPDEPLFSACSQAYENARRQERNRRIYGLLKFSFDGLSVPEAIIKLRQGAGRLIRHETDCGILIICDPRLYSKRHSYGDKIIASLPEMRQGLALEQLLPFLSQARASRSAPAGTVP